MREIMGFEVFVFERDFYYCSVNFEIGRDFIGVYRYILLLLMCEILFLMLLNVGRVLC